MGHYSIKEYDPSDSEKVVEFYSHFKSDFVHFRCKNSHDLEIVLRERGYVSGYFTWTRESTKEICRLLICIIFHKYINEMTLTMIDKSYSNMKEIIPSNIWEELRGSSSRDGGDRDKPGKEGEMPDLS